VAACPVRYGDYDLPGLAVRHVTNVDAILQGQESITKVEENGDVVVVMEKRTLNDGREGQFVLRVRHSYSFFPLILCCFVFISDFPPTVL